MLSLACLSCFRWKPFFQFLVLGAWAASFPRLQADSVEDVDHARIIRSWNSQSQVRGEKLYNGTCITCHGNQTVDGTLPTSRKFWEAEFKNGNDPLSLYKTLVNGFGQMPAQPWMTPEMAYDVIHYVRERLVKEDNPRQYFEVTPEYLERLPKGRGLPFQKTPAMLEAEKGPAYLRMDFGPVLLWTYQVAPGNIAYKGIAVRLDDGPGGISKGRVWMLYDHDTLRAAAGWSGEGFVDWKGIAFDGSHQTHTSIVGKESFVNPVGPGWANPSGNTFADPRFRGRDGKPYGPLPRAWAHYKGLYLSGQKAVLSYTVGNAQVLESPGYEQSGQAIAFTRTLNIGPSPHDLQMRVAPAEVAAMLAGVSAARLVEKEGFIVLEIPASATPINLKLLISDADPAVLTAFVLMTEPASDLSSLTAGGEKRWKETLVTAGKMGANENAFAVDVLEPPAGENNAWNSWMRFGGFDFFEESSRAALCTWNGDVWVVSGIEGNLKELKWNRVASGLFQPLGVRVIDGTIYVTCRDQIAELRDLNGDGEVDFYRNFNNDHQVTEHFHEFAMGLQTDEEGNFYYAKSARHALPALVAHHGTLLKVSKDGLTTEILATGFRAANGVCLNGDGSFFVTDQEGHWTPKNRINWVQPGGFYGNMMGYHDRASSEDSEMEQPLVWITNEMDRSPGELLWVTSDQWGPLKGSLLNLSYGTGRIYLVPHERVAGQMQGGVVPLPIPDFPTGVMRGRFHPKNGQLYACGMFAWAGNRQQDGGFYRVRYTGQETPLPVQLNAYRDGIGLGFSGALDPESAAQAANYRVKVWSLKRTSNYGSKHHDERELKVRQVVLSPDQKSVFLSIPGLSPTWCMEIAYEIRAANGQLLERRIHNTIHRLRDSRFASSGPD